VAHWQGTSCSKAHIQQSDSVDANGDLHFVSGKSKPKCPQCHQRQIWMELFLWASAVSAICQENSVFSKQIRRVCLSFTFDILSQCPRCHCDDFVLFVACNCWIFFINLYYLVDRFLPSFILIKITSLILPTLMIPSLYIT